jgi:hypothetical protein
VHGAGIAGGVAVEPEPDAVAGDDPGIVGGSNRGDAEAELGEEPIAASRSAQGR